MKTFFLVLAVLLGAMQSGSELALNLAAAAPPPERSDQAGRIHEGCVSATSGAPPVPFRVTLADTDRAGYKVGDTIFFDVIIENISAAPLVLGISRDPDVAPKTMRPCRVVSPGVQFNVALVAMRKTGPGAHVAVATGYYGSPDVPGTTFALQPGERVRVQMAAELRPTVGMDPIPATGTRPVRIKAFVMIDGESMRAAYSENALAIEVNARVRGRPQ